MSVTLRRQRLLGRNHERYGHYSVAPFSPQTVAAISAGSDLEWVAEHPKTHVNEDALLLLESERHTVLCVADAHFGREASEELIMVLGRALDPVPQTPAELDTVFAALAAERDAFHHRSETTLLVAVLDRMFRQGFGRSWGDSSLVCVRAGAVPEQLNEKGIDYVTLARPATLGIEGGNAFSFSVAPGNLLLAYTDGIDECCYRDPDRSITLDVLAGVLRETRNEPRAVLDALMQLALVGVAGHAGGQDNAALIVTRT